MAEHFDIVDENNNLLGKKKSRADVHRDGDWHREIHVFVLNKNNEFLCNKRSATKDFFPNHWDTVCGGHVDPGETYESAALRELKEEIGINANESDLIPLETVKYTEEFPEKHFKNHTFRRVFLYKAELKLHSLKAQKEEVSELKFFPIPVLKKLVKKHDGAMPFWPRPDYDMYFLEKIEKFLTRTSA